MNNRRLILLELLFSLLVLLSIGCGKYGGGSCDASDSSRAIAITWDANKGPDIAGYKVYHRTAPRTYGPGIDVGNATSFQITGLIRGQKYYISVTAYDRAGKESNFSNEVTGIAK